jgi:hypothetical protein
VLDIEKAKKTAEHKFWPILVKDDKLAYVLLNGEKRPAVYPQPVVSLKPFKLPLIFNKDKYDVLYFLIKIGAFVNQYHSLLW